MFRHVARQVSHSARRYASTHAGTSARSVNARKYALGASVAAASFMLWSLHSTGSALHLDNQSTAAKSSKPVAKKTTPSDSDASSQSGSTDKTTERDVPSGDESTPSPEPSAEGGEGGAGGAFNPETGEINWDCPCLGGMAHGPCGQQFRDAFSCFVYSEEEPKGINCVEKFKAMQDCFREHPEVYGDEIMDDDDDEVPQATPAEGAAPIEDKAEEAKIESPGTEPSPKQTSRRSKAESATVSSS